MQDGLQHEGTPAGLLADQSCPRSRLLARSSWLGEERPTLDLLSLTGLPIPSFALISLVNAPSRICTYLLLAFPVQMAVVPACPDSQYISDLRACRVRELEEKRINREMA